MRDNGADSAEPAARAEPEAADNSATVDAASATVVKGDAWHRHAPWAVRAALREWRRSTASRHGDRERVCVALSGGADSLALTAAACAEFVHVRALIVDHGLQPGSAQVAAAAAATARQLGAETSILTVHVGRVGGPEAAAREARYRALATARGGDPVLLAHTLDDQAETVLLGLARGSGLRSLRAMAPWDPPYGRPLLDLPGTLTRQACVELGLEYWEDPHNTDPRFRRVRIRHELMPLLRDILGPGTPHNLARTAAQARRDDEALSALAAAAYATATQPDDDGPAVPTDSAAGGAPRQTTALSVAELREHHPAVRSRIIRVWLQDCGASELRASQIDAVLALSDRAGGAAAVAIPWAGKLCDPPGQREEAKPAARTARMTVQRQGQWLRLRVS